jgi:hypothetical protein
MADLTDLVTGARVAAVIYLRKIEWYFNIDPIAVAF